MLQPRACRRPLARAPIALGAGIFALVACNNRPGGVDPDRAPWDPATPGTTTLTSENVATDVSSTTVARIVDARCARADACKDIGRGRQFSTREACASILTADMREEFTSPACSGTIDGRKLEHCLGRIGGEACGSPVAELERVRACDPSELCVAAHRRPR